ncbi:MAG: sulfite exporter TauE/SafE family protein [Firmicutes bacterium]|nr:sulfite exporter TauE/SafE family protein [Bacillota bacterium]
MHFGIFAPGAFAVAFAIVLTAFFVRGIVGFGSGLISVSLLILLIPIRVAVPIVYVVDTVGSFALGTYDFKHIRWTEMPWLWPATVLGLAVGAFVLKHAPAQHLTLILGLFILLYVAYALAVRPERLPLIGRAWGGPLGFLGGVIGSLYGGGGPAIVAYLQMRKLDKRVFRATFQFIAITDGVVRGALYWAIGLLQPAVLETGLWLLPAVALGLWAGNRLHFRIRPRPFQLATVALRAAAGLTLMLPL